jgi:hypothetical protein
MLAGNLSLLSLGSQMLKGTQEWVWLLPYALVGFIGFLLLLLASKVCQLYLLTKRRATIATIKITPPGNTRYPLQRSEEFFRYIHAYLSHQKDRQFWLSPRATIEIVATPHEGLFYRMRVHQQYAQAITQALKSFLPDAKIERVENSIESSWSLVYHYRLRHKPHQSLRIMSSVDQSDPLTFIASSLSDLQPEERVCIQAVITPIGPVARLRAHHQKERARSCHDDEMFQKLSRPLFRATLRVAVEASTKRQSHSRLRAISSSLAVFAIPGVQGIVRQRVVFPFHQQLITQSFKASGQVFSPRLLVSVSEMSSLFHPHSSVGAQGEDLALNRSVILPPPISMKRSNSSRVTFGHSIDTDHSYSIGLNDNDRSRHVYMLGQTGSGKSTIIYHMARADMASGQGLAVIDPHGDLIIELLSVVPEERIEDTILFDPSDISYPIGLNLLELDSSLTDPDEILQDKELVCESVISIFRRLFGNEKTDSHRIEYVLRNTIHTAFTVPEATIFTVYDLLNNPKYQKKITAKLTDPHLKNFWTYEFGKAGDYQQVKMVSGVTAKIGRFLFSPSIKRMFEQPHSTIDFTSIIDNQKILLCNLSEGKLGEDNSHLLGIAVIAKLHLALLRRAKQDMTARLPFYLFVDEFQHYASDSFTGLLSGGRKFGLRVTLAQQSTAQLEDKRTIEVILANTGTVICFRTASPMDADTILPQFAPYVTQQDLVNLPRHRFYLKLGSKEPEQAFSGITLPIASEANAERVEAVKTYSREHYARAYVDDLPGKIGSSSATRPIVAAVIATAIPKADKKDPGSMKVLAQQKTR